MAQTGSPGSGSATDSELAGLLATAQEAAADDRWAEAKEALRRGADRAADLGDAAGAVRIRLQLAVLQASTGHVDAGLAGIEACTTSAEPLVDGTLMVEIHGAAASLLLAAARPRPAVERFRSGLNLAVDLPDPRWQVQLRTGLAVALFQTGEPETSLEALRENADFARALPDAVTAGMALETVSEALTSLGRPGDALPVALEALAKFEEGEAGPFLVQASIEVSNLYLVGGQPQKAAEYTNQALALGRTFGGPSGESSVLMGLAGTAIQRGDGASARQFLERARACIKAGELPEPPELSEMLKQLDAPSGPGT